MKKMMGEVKDAGSYKIISVHMSDENYLKNSYSDDGQYILIPREGEDKWGLIHNAVETVLTKLPPLPAHNLQLK